jgi:hypothetical protein
MAVTTFKNIRDNKSGTLLTAITATQTTLTLNTGQGASFPAAPFYISCDYEVMICTAKVGDVFTVTRGADNTIAAIHAAGSLVEMRSVAALWNDLAAAINAIESGANPAALASIVANGSVVDASVAVGAAIALSKLARYPFTNADLASDVARANLLINGGFDVWQRGTPFGATGLYTADRWIMQTVGTDALSVQRDTANRDIGSVACALLSFSLGTGAGQSGIYQQLKTSEHQIAGKTISASMRVKTTLANAIKFQLSSDGTGATNSVSAFHTGNGVYQTLTATMNIPVDATIVQIQVLLSAGTTQAFYVDNTMLVIGSVPADYYPLTPADDLARCQRYYQKILASGTATFLAGNATAAGQVFPWVTAIIPMGGVPVVTKIGAWVFTNSTFGAVDITTAGQTFNQVRIYVNSIAAGYLSAGFNAGEGITLEWNP